MRTDCAISLGVEAGWTARSVAKMHQMWLVIGNKNMSYSEKIARSLADSGVVANWSSTILVVSFEDYLSAADVLLQPSAQVLP